jgi:hypothetical protein
MDLKMAGGQLLQTVKIIVIEAEDLRSGVKPNRLLFIPPLRSPWWQFRHHPHQSLR